MRLGTGPRLLSCPELRTYDTRLPAQRRHLSVSLMCLRDLLAQELRLGIHFYRMSSHLIPMPDAADPTAALRQMEECRGLLRCLGEEVKRTDIRLTVHPMLQVQLGSRDPRLVRQGLAAAETWARVMEGMGLGPEARVVVHVGGGAAPSALDAFAENSELLSDQARDRLAIENDDRAHSLDDVLRLSARVGMPVVFDYLHWRCTGRGGSGLEEALAAAFETWPDGVRPKVHFSSPSTGRAGRPPRLGEHGDYLDPFAFEDFLAAMPRRVVADVMLEAKAKDLALLKLRRDLDGRLDRRRTSLEAAYA